MTTWEVTFTERAPVRLLKGRHPRVLVELHANDRRQALLLLPDTGASHTMIDSKRARTLGYTVPEGDPDPTSEDWESVTAANGAELWVHRFPGTSLRIAGTAVSVAMDVWVPTVALGKEILGRDFFSVWMPGFDFAESQLFLVDRASDPIEQR